MEEEPSVRAEQSLTVCATSNLHQLQRIQTPTFLQLPPTPPSIQNLSADLGHLIAAIQLGVTTV